MMIKGLQLENIIISLINKTDKIKPHKKNDIKNELSGSVKS